MSVWGSVAGTRIVRGTVSIPLLGAWSADVELAASVALGMSVSVVIGNLTLTGAPYRQIQYAGRTIARLVAGANGWSKQVRANSYANPSGVLMSTVLADAATQVGETVNVVTDGSLGARFFVFASKASRVLRSISGSEWWIDVNGVTQVGSRPAATAVTSAFQVAEYDGARGVATVATEDFASWMPGATFATSVLSQQTVQFVRHTIPPDGSARMTILTS